MKKFELAIIGGGPGGYVAAIRAAKLGLSVALIEGRDLGGTCLNRGCIPSKTLLKHADVLNQIKDANQFGIQVENISYSINDIVSRKNRVVKQLKSGITSLLRQNKIAVFQGYGHVHDNKSITIKQNQETEVIQADKIILANGSIPFVPPLTGLDDIDYHTSDTIFDITEVPKRLVIVGGGVIGLEIACIFNSFGTKVEIVESLEVIIPSEDREAAHYLLKQLESSGITIHTSAKITGFLKDENLTVVNMVKNNETIKLTTDAVLIAVGRTPNMTGLGDLSVQFDGRFVKVDKNMQTSLPGIYAVGDLVGGYQLAHVASHEGITAVNHIIGQEKKRDYTVPRCIYTFPEVASVGLSEEQARSKGYCVKVKKADIAINGKAIATGETAGFMKIIADETYGEILGVVMVGSHVTEMISQATSFIHLEGTIEELENMIFPHPTIVESLFEAAGAWLSKGIHII